MLKYVILFYALLLINSICQAQRVKGYIVTENSDTISGKIKFYIYNQNSDGILIHGIDLEWYHSMVKFKSDTEKRYRKYEPEMLLGYVFQYQSTNYIFHKFKLDMNSIFQSESIQYRFLNLIYKGEISLYRDIIRVPSAKYHTNKSTHISELSEVYYNYYLYDNKTGLKNVVAQKDTTTVAELLRCYGLDETFLKNIPADTKFKNIKSVLEDYDRWMYESSLKNLNI